MCNHVPSLLLLNIIRYIKRVTIGHLSLTLWPLGFWFFGVFWPLGFCEELVSASSLTIILE